MRERNIIIAMLCTIGINVGFSLVNAYHSSYWVYQLMGYNPILTMLFYLLFPMSIPLSIIGYSAIKKFNKYKLVKKDEQPTNKGGE